MDRIMFYIYHAAMSYHIFRGSGLSVLRSLRLCLFMMRDQEARRRGTVQDFQRNAYSDMKELAGKS
ncbi:hypothetical protein [Dinoroseobacter sp. S375]|uniref:hypothetical protein n=1 Tax=Dinoroseobacter sp. S375 TaxID=3415136 RepID=UPI003C7D7E3D